jgi:hypothetical protein
MTIRLPFIFLSSMGRSGSTLVAFLMNTHPNIATVSEMTGLSASVSDVDNYRCSCGARLKDCDFWQNVQQGMEERGYPLDLRDFDTRMVWKRRPLWQRIQTADLRFCFLNQLRDIFLLEVPGYPKRMRYLVERNVALAKTILAVS